MTTTGGASTLEQTRSQWDRIAPAFDELMTPVNIGHGDDVLARVGVTEGTRFLDVAAGSGALAIPAARRGARVTATDLSPVMLDRLRARARSEGLEIRTRVMDGQALELADDEFDVSASQHGVSLFPDMDAGVAELVRVTRPGGRVAVVAFGPPEQVEFLAFFLGALHAAVPGFVGFGTDPPPLPFQAADPDRLGDRLRRAGLGDVRVETVDWQMRVASATRLWDVVTSSNPIGGHLVATLTEEQSTTARTVLEGMLRERRGDDDSAVLHNGVNIGTGTSGRGASAR